MENRCIKINEINFTLEGTTLKIEGTGKSILDFDFYDKLIKTNFDFANVDCIDIRGVKEINAYFVSTYQFEKFYNLKNITFSDNNLVEIGHSTFNKCESLESINIPDSVTKIGGHVFCHCKSLKSITIPTSVSKIGDYAFYGCESLESITMPNGVTEIKDGTFGCCKLLKNIEILGSVTEIGENAFYGCESLESINIPNNVTKIGKKAFEYCTSLKNIIIPDKVVEIEYATFYHCKLLESIIISDNITKIGKFAFSECISLENITMSNRLVEIEEYAFYGCKSLTSINIPESVTKIGEEAFEYCKSLLSVNIPDNIAEIGKKAFLGCEKIKKVIIPKNYSKNNIYISNLFNCKVLSEIIPSLEISNTEALIMPKSETFNLETITKLCKEDARLAKILFKEFFTNNSYFLDEKEIALFTMISIAVKNNAQYSNWNELNKIILENINSINDIDELILIMFVLKKSNSNYWKDTIDLLNARLNILTRNQSERYILGEIKKLEKQ